MTPMLTIGRTRPVRPSGRVRMGLSAPAAAGVVGRAASGEAAPLQPRSVVAPAPTSVRVKNSLRLSFPAIAGSFLIFIRRHIVYDPGAEANGRVNLSRAPPVYTGEERNDDQILSVAHPSCDLLAAGPSGAPPLPHHLAPAPAAPAHRHHRRGRLRPVQ